MRSFLSIAIAASTAALSSADTTVAILEFGKGGTVRRTTTPSSQATSTPAAVASFWNVMHRRTKRTVQHAGMSVVPDIFNQADAGVVIGIRGSGADLASMPNVMSLVGDGASGDNLVGHVHLPGQVGGDLMNRASKGVKSISDKALFGPSLRSTADKAFMGLEGIETLSLSVENDAAASEADDQLRRVLKTLQDQAASNGKTIVVHLVFEEESGASRRKTADSEEESLTRRRLEEDNEEDNEDNQNNNNQNNNNNNNNNQNNNNYYANGYSYSSEKSMYEIQNFNVFLWTAIGLASVLFMVLGYFIDMPLMPDTLLFGETAKIAGGD